MTGPERTSTAFGAAIRAARRERGWSQESLADLAHVSRPSIARIERGEDVSTGTLSKVAGALSLTVSVIPEAHP